MTGPATDHVFMSVRRAERDLIEHAAKSIKPFLIVITDDGREIEYSLEKLVRDWDAMHADNERFDRKKA